jgi:hypothetical protein
MVLRDGSLKMIDFGIARHFQPSKTATLLGTPGYAPPEKYRGKVDPRSDLYALAAVLHQALTGRDPSTEAPFSFPPVAQLAPNAPPYLAKAVDLALSHNPVNHPQTAAAMKALLTFPFTSPGQSPSPSTARTVTIPSNLLARGEKRSNFRAPRWFWWSGVAVLLFFAIYNNQPHVTSKALSSKTPEVKWEEVRPEDVRLQTNAEACSSFYSAGQFQQAFRPCLVAVLSGNVDAEFSVGYMYDTGSGGLVNYENALYWYEKAAAQGAAGAAYNIGVIYENGRGVIQDYSEARNWYENAAIKGEPDALAALGRMYEFGKGAKPNLVEAYKWYNLAARKDNRFASDRDRMTTTTDNLWTDSSGYHYGLSPEQTSEAQRRARDWLARHPEAQ